MNSLINRGRGGGRRSQDVFGEHYRSESGGGDIGTSGPRKSRIAARRGKARCYRGNFCHVTRPGRPSLAVLLLAQRSEIIDPPKCKRAIIPLYRRASAPVWYAVHA